MASPDEMSGLTFWAKSPILVSEETEVFTMPDFAGALGAKGRIVAAAVIHPQQGP
jgi:hypothetical protein